MQRSGGYREGVWANSHARLGPQRWKWRVSWSLSVSEASGGVSWSCCRGRACGRYLLFRDTQHHNKPHVHVYYGEFEASVGVDGELLAGSLPRRQMKIVVGWLALHEEEVYAAWNKAVQGEHFDRIEPM